MYDEDGDLAIEPVIRAGADPKENQERINKAVHDIVEALNHKAADAEMKARLDGLQSELRSIREAQALQVHQDVSGSDAELRRYIYKDARSGDHKIRLYGGEVGGVWEDGILDDAHPRSEWHRDLQDAVSQLSLVVTLLHDRRRDMVGDPATARRVAPKSVANLQRVVRQAPAEIRRLFNDTAGTGGDFIPAEIRLPMLDSAALLDTSKRLVGVFDEVVINSATVKNPFLSSLAVPYLYGIPGSEPVGTFNTSTPGTDVRTMTAQGIATRVLYSNDADEDAIISMLPVLRDASIRGHSFGVEDAIINGDATATHQDDIANWTPAWAPSGVTWGSTLDHRRAWTGLRARAVDVSSTADDSTFSDTVFRGRIAGMTAGHRMPSDLVCITGVSGWLKTFQSVANVTTVDKYGPNAPIITGELAKANGVAITVSDLFPENLNNSGLFDNSTKDKTGYLLVNKSRFKRVRRRGPLVEIEKVIESGVSQVVITQRVGFHTSDDSSTKNIYYGYKFTS